MVADSHALDAMSNGLHDARRLMPQRHRERARARPVHDGEIGVAKARTLDANPDLASTGRCDGESFDGKRAAVGVWARSSRLAEDRATHPWPRESAR